MKNRPTEYEVEGPNVKGFYHIKRVEWRGLDRTAILESEHRTEAEAQARAAELRAGTA